MKFLPAVILFFILFFPSNVFSAERGGLTVEPAYSEIVLSTKDDQKTLTLKYTNNSDKPVKLDLFPYDYKQINEKGQLEFEVKDSYEYSLVSYLSFEASSIEVGPKETRSFNIVIKNRPDITPGGHYAAVIARVSPEASGSANALVTPALSSLILLRKTGGEVFDIKLSKADFPSSAVVFSIPDYITADFYNTGNIHLIPYGTVEITDIFGRKLYESQLNIDSNIILPGTKRFIKNNLREVNRPFPVSLNKLSIKGQDSLKKTKYFYYDTFLYINPWVGVALGVVVGLFIYLKYAKKRKAKD